MIKKGANGKWFHNECGRAKKFVMRKCAYWNRKFHQKSIFEFLQYLRVFSRNFANCQIRLFSATSETELRTQTTMPDRKIILVAANVLSFQMRHKKLDWKENTVFFRNFSSQLQFNFFLIWLVIRVYRLAILRKNLNVLMRDRSSIT